jgi:hypothetical protein
MSSDILGQQDVALELSPNLRDSMSSSTKSSNLGEPVEMWVVFVIP